MASAHSRLEEMHRDIDISSSTICVPGRLIEPTFCPCGVWFAKEILEDNP